jgi:hypothetical protein
MNIWLKCAGCVWKEGIFSYSYAPDVLIGTVKQSLKLQGGSKAAPSAVAPSG